METISVTCPKCSCCFETEVNAGKILGSKRSEAKTAAARANSRHQRPNAKGKKKPRKAAKGAEPAQARG